MSTVILGSGVIGLSTAYYLSRLTSSNEKKHDIHLVDPSPELFASASGKAAGFLARDWFAPAVTPLGELSFDLHRQLAEEFNGRERWGWSESLSWSMDRDTNSESGSEDGEEVGEEEESESDYDSVGGEESPDETTDAEFVNGQVADAIARNEEAVNADADETTGPTTTTATKNKTDLGWLMDGSSRASLLGDNDQSTPAIDDSGQPSVIDHPKWIRSRADALQVISDRTTTGQVDPLRLCEFLLEQCVKNGVTLHHPARATEIVRGNRKDPIFKSTTYLRVRYLDEKSRYIDIPCGSLVIAAGCWTSKVYKTLFPNASRVPKVTPLAGHSVVMKSKRWSPLVDPMQSSLPIKTNVPGVMTLPSGHSMSTDPIEDLHEQGGSSSDTTPPAERPNPLRNARNGRKAAKINEVATVLAGGNKPTFAKPSPRSTVCHAVFTSDPSGFSPEIFSRAGGDVWLGGLNSSSIPLPSLATGWKETMSQDSIQTLINVGKKLCGDDIEIIRSGLCFRPVSPTGRPIIAKVHEADLGDGISKLGGGARGEVHGVYVATGHGPWGISLSLGTGMVMAEMVLGRKTTVDVSALGTWEAQAP